MSFPPKPPLSSPLSSSFLFLFFLLPRSPHSSRYKHNSKPIVVRRKKNQTIMRSYIGVTYHCVCVRSSFFLSPLSSAPSRGSRNSTGVCVRTHVPSFFLSPLFLLFLPLFFSLFSPFLSSPCARVWCVCVCERLSLLFVFASFLCFYVFP